KSSKKCIPSIVHAIDELLHRRELGGHVAKTLSDSLGGICTGAIEETLDGILQCDDNGNRNLNITSKLVEELTNLVALLKRLVKSHQEITDISGEIQKTTTATLETSEELTDHAENTEYDLLTDVQNSEESCERSFEIVRGLRSNLQGV